MNFRSELEKRPIFGIIAGAAHELKLETYVIGGYVRDLILKRPSKDVDFVCVGNGMALAKKVSKALENAPLIIFRNFGTAMIKHNDMELEFVGARKESYSRNSRKPSVESGTLKDDLDRRDFTINALAISINKSNFGELIDPFNGLSDLKKKMVVTPKGPSSTFSDDPLRMMRAIRFASQLDFDIDPDTFQAIKDNLDRIDIVSQERITGELNKIILSPVPSYGFKLLSHAGLLRKIFPEMMELQGVEVIRGKGHKDNFYHTLEVLDNVAAVSDNLWLRWAAILHDIAKPATQRFDEKVGWTFHGHEDKGARMVPGIFRRLRLPLNDKMKFVGKLVRLHLRPIALVRDEITDSAVRRLIYEAGDDLDALMKLCRADVTSKNHARVKRYLSNFDKVERKIALVEAKDQVRNFQPVITGEVIMKTLDIKPGRIVGEIKEAVKEAILEGEIKNEFDEAYQYMLSIARDRGLSLQESTKSS